MEVIWQLENNTDYDKTHLINYFIWDDEGKDFVNFPFFLSIISLRKNFLFGISTYPWISPNPSLEILGIPDQNKDSTKSLVSETLL